MKKGMRGVSLLLVLMLLLGMFPAMSIEVEAADKIITNEQIEKAIEQAEYLKKTQYNQKAGYWTGYCAAFVWNAYNKGAKIGNRSYSDARVMGDALIQHTDGNPPRGAFVFWADKKNPGSSYGHVGLSLGNGTVIHAYGGKYPICVTAISTVNKSHYTYRGWGAPIAGYTLATEKINTCTHKNIQYGVCPDCKYTYNFDGTKNVQDSGVYKVTKGTSGTSLYLKDTPYSNAPNGRKVVQVGGTLSVLYSVTNYNKEKWYYAEYTAAQVRCQGYIPSGNVQRIGSLPVTIRFSDNITQPQSFTQRASYKQNLTSGSVTAKDGNIRSVQAFFFRAGGSVSDKSCWDRERTDVIPVDKNLYTINSSSKINLQLTFGNLKAGSYQYGIEAIDSNGEAWYWASRTFTVSPVSQPKVKNCDLRFGQAVAVDGGIRATISSSTPGAKVTVTPAERIIQNSGSSVTVELRYSQTVSASASASGYQTVRGSQTYNVGSCAEPDFYLNETPEGTTVTLTCSTGGASIYYSLDGVTFSPYASPLTLTSTQTVYAYAQKAGCTTSETREQLVSVTAPAAPVLTAGGLGSDVPVGTVLAVSWPEIRNAADYEVTVSVNGAETTQTVTQSQASVTADAAGIYEFQVRARNAAGFGDSSQRLRITAHEPSTVRFVNYDGALLTEQSVP